MKFIGSSCHFPPLTPHAKGNWKALMMNIWCWRWGWQEAIWHSVLLPSSSIPSGCRCSRGLFIKSLKRYLQSRKTSHNHNKYFVRPTSVESPPHKIIPCGSDGRKLTRCRENKNGFGWSIFLPSFVFFIQMCGSHEIRTTHSIYISPSDYYEKSMLSTLNLGRDSMSSHWRSPEKADRHWKSLANRSPSHRAGGNKLQEPLPMRLRIYLIALTLLFIDPLRERSELGEGKESQSNINYPSSSNFLCRIEGRACDIRGLCSAHTHIRHWNRRNYQNRMKY